MSVPRGWIVVHDAETETKKRPEGSPVLIKTRADCSIRPYATGRTRTVLGLPSGFLHTVEDQTQIARLIEENP